MDSIVRNIRLAAFAAELCSTGMLFVLESVVVLVCRRIASRVIRHTLIAVVSVPCIVAYRVLLEKLAWSFTSRVAIIEGLDFGWLQYWLLPSLTISASLIVFRRDYRAQTAPN